MRRSRSPLGRLALAGGLGLAVTSAFYVLAPSGSQDKAEATPRAAVVTVSRHVPAFSKLTAADLKVQQVPAPLAPQGALRESGVAEGRFVRQDLYPGEPLVDAKLFPAGQEYPTVLPLPQGRRAVTIAVNEVVGVAGFITVGSLVDVIATIDVDQQSVSRIILQNIQVLAAAQNPQKEDSPQAKVVSSVTLAVTPQEAETLTLATEKGAIRLAMRSPLEGARVETTGLSPAELLKGRATPAKPAPAAAPARVARVASTPARPAPAAAKPAGPFDPGIMVIRGTHTSYVQR